MASSSTCSGLRTLTEALPHSVDAEEAALGAMLVSASAAADVVAVLRPEDFIRRSHALVFTAGRNLLAAGKPVDPITVVEELRRVGSLEAAGGDLFVAGLAGGVALPNTGGHHAAIVREKAELRTIIERASGWIAAAFDGGTPASLTAQIREAFPADFGSARREVLDGGTWLLDGPDDLEPVWGEGENTLMARGEPLMIVAPDGGGKTTLANNLAIALAGIVPCVLGFPVCPVRRVLYIAADRPRQIRRSFRRMVGESERADLTARLAVHPGPLPFDVLRDPRGLALFAQDAGADVVIVDSLGAIVAGLAKDEVGAGVRIALDHVVQAGVDAVVLHHNRKPTGDNREPRKLEDVYGSRWLTAGCGSVISLWGDAGAPVLSFRHLKQPAAEVGPFRIEAARDGWVTVSHGSDLKALLERPGGVTPREAARTLYEADSPARADVERARRQLERAVESGRAFVLNPDRPHQDAARYGAAAPQTWLEGLR